MTGLIVVPARLVEIAIAGTIVVTALDNIRPFLPGRRWLGQKARLHEIAR
jgi:hypothetical protein